MLYVNIASFIIVIYLPTSFCECQQSYATICDSFEDLSSYHDKEAITDLIIGSDNLNNELTSIHLTKDLQLYLYNSLTSLTILRKIKELEMTYAFECNYLNLPLKFLKFYGNEMKEIEEYHFPVFAVTRLSLVNNKIESIKGGAFNNHEIEEFDASDNLLEVVEENALPVTAATKVIILENNRISHIEQRSFPTGLKSLRLRKNKLRYLQKEVITGLASLEELNISTNKFNEIPDIKNLRKLIIFDISNNQITNIPDKIFEQMANLQLLDLSGNRIYDNSFLSSIILPGKQPSLTISMAMNKLTFLNLTGLSLQEQKFVIYGNPWDCARWDQLKNQISGHESECDTEFFSSGKAPFCFKIVNGDYWLNDNFKRDVSRFHGVVKNSVNTFSCKLTPNRYKLLHSIGFGCVG